MIVEIAGAGGGFKEYLETGRKAGRELHRNRLDQRIPLFGDLGVFELATSSYKTMGKRYDHVTLSFNEHHVSDEMLQIAVNEFRDHAFAAWSETERHRIAFYAEAHRPKMLSYINAETGEEVKRYTHIHIGIGKRDLLTGKFVELLGYLGPESDNLKFIDTYQESFNSRHGFSSPKDNPKITPENAIDMLARYNGQKTDAMGSFNERKALLELNLQKEIISRDITSWDDFGKLLAEHGAVSKVNSGKFNECYRVKQTGADKAMRLTGIFFLKKFIEHPTQEKLRIISEKAGTAYLEKMQPKKESAYVTETLNHWKDFASREIRYIHKSSRLYKELYLPADAANRRQILDNIEREHHGITSAATTRHRKIATTRSRMPAMPVRNLDGIQKRSEMLLRGNTHVDVYHRSIAEYRSDGLRRTDQIRRSVDDYYGEMILEKTCSSKLNIPPDLQNKSNNFHEILQPSSVIVHVLSAMRDRYEQAEEMQRYAEIRRHIDCTQLLSSLSYTHRLDMALYQVATGKDGSPRIQCGSRMLSPSDFLTKEIGLPWKDAAPILRRVYENQISSTVIRPRSKSQSGQLWKEFRQEQKLRQIGLSQNNKKWNEGVKFRRVTLFAKLNDERKFTLHGLVCAERKAAASIHSFRAAIVKAEFNELIKEQRLSLRASNYPAENEAWKVFLQVRAQVGNIYALSALRKLDDTVRPPQFHIAAITSTIYLELNEVEIRRRLVAQQSVVSMLKALFFSVGLNGDITYVRHGHAVLRDEGRHIAVLDEHNEDVIVAGLLLGREKFGGLLTLTGSDEFKQRAVAIAVNRGIAVQFSDPQLEFLRNQLVDIQRNTSVIHLSTMNEGIIEIVPITAESITATSSRANQRTNRSIVPVEELNSSNLLPVGQDVPEPLLAQEWLKKWSAENGKSMRQAKSGNGNTPFSIVYISANGVVLDQGRSGAVYPVPSDIDLKVGDKVVINKNKELSALPVPDRANEFVKSRR